MDANEQLAFARISAEDALVRTESGKKGLSLKEARYRLKQSGANRLHYESARPAISQLQRLASPLVATILLTAIFAVYIDNLKLAILLVVAAAINLVAFFYQAKTRGSYIRALSKLVSGEITVQRSGRQAQIDSTEIVPGDIVILHGGEIVPADLRLIESEKLILDNANLSGESRHLRASTETSQSKFPGKAQNLALMGAYVLGGEGRGVAMATGTNTWLGQLIRNRQLFQVERDVRRITVSLLRLAILTVIGIGLASLIFNQSLDQFVIFATTVVLALLPVSLASEISLVANTKQLSQPNTQGSLKAMLQCVITNASTVGLLTLLGVVGRIWFHVPLAITALHILILYMVFQLVTQVAFGKELSAAKTQKHIINVRLSLAYGLLGAVLAYGNYLLFFARQDLSPAYIDTTSTLYGHAIVITQLTVVLCQFINLLLTRADTHKKFFTNYLLDNKKLLLSFAFALFCIANMAYTPPIQSFFHAAPLSVGDWVTAAVAAIIYLGARLLQRHTRKHSRQAIIKLHHEIHGKNAGAKI
jgi:magnesium-transporting ATPase (P-type)